MSKIDKSFTKKDLLELIELYDMDIDDSFNLPKSNLQNEIISFLKYNEISQHDEYPEILTSEDLNPHSKKTHTLLSCIILSVIN